VTVELVNAWTGPIVVGLILALFAAMAGRVLRHVLKGRRVPLLLKRDVLLFAAFALLVLGSQYSRATGVRLAGELWWVLLTNALGIVALGVWLLIEIGVIGHGKGEDRWT